MVKGPIPCFKRGKLVVLSVILAICVGLTVIFTTQNLTLSNSGTLVANPSVSITLQNVTSPDGDKILREILKQENIRGEEVIDDTGISEVAHIREEPVKATPINVPTKNSSTSLNSTSEIITSAKVLNPSPGLAALADSAFVGRQDKDFKTKCRGTEQYLTEYSQRSAAVSGVVVLDWSSRGKFNGVGNEIQHYMELIAMGLASRRVFYVQTQLPGCPGTRLDDEEWEALSSEAEDQIRAKCHFDLGDHFRLLGGESWKWDRPRKERVREELGGEVEEVLVTWRQDGMWRGEEKLAEPDANLLKILMESELWTNSPWVRISVEQDFGRWCHEPPRPGGGSDFGMCHSYRWAVGIEGHAPGQVKGGGGACLGYATLQPKPLLTSRILPALATLQNQDPVWTTLVGVHLRTGFSDVSQLPRPALSRIPSLRPSPTYSPDHLDQFLHRTLSHNRFPPPHCPAPLLPHDRQHDHHSATSSSEFNHSRPMAEFFRCTAEVARGIARRQLEARGLQAQGVDLDRHWGVYLSTDSPYVKRMLEQGEVLVPEAAPQVSGIPRGHETPLAPPCPSGGPAASSRHSALKVVSSSGTFGHVTLLSPTCETRHANCSRSDPREPWMKSMVDLYMLSMCDKIMLMFESSYSNAALVRSFGQGRVTYYEHRLTHQYTDKVLTSFKQHKPSIIVRRNFAELWDLFGPV